MYPIALDSGMTIREFWESSLFEIEDFVSSYNRRRKQRMSMIFMEAEVLTNHIAAAFDQKVTPLMPWDYDPEGFKREKEAFIRRKEELDLQQYKERRRMRMNQFNAMRHGEEVE